MKKQIAFLSTAALMLCAAGAAMPVSAADSAEITVTVSNAGELVVKQETLKVTDADGDGALTVNDALMLTHHQYYGDEGYVTVQSDWGMSIQTLWGVTNGGSYGYTVNDRFANSLTDPLKDGDDLYAYVYADAAGYSDVYTYFDIKDAGTVTSEDTITLTLNSIRYDANWQPVTAPVAGANLVINGEKTDITTDENGQVMFRTMLSGDLVISAVSDQQTLVPPVCKVTVNAVTSETTTETTGTTSETTASTAAQQKGNNNNTVTVTGAKTGDTDAIPALAIAALLAGCTAFMMRRDKE
ncbi:MAG: hypothetical protein IKI58_05255 [Oscillospiraceae bacterium]|nr:hypothetical protein [Oscillospiraceae bacterium]